MFIIKFQDIALYADINGKTVSVTRSAANTQFPYQVTQKQQHHYSHAKQFVWTLTITTTQIQNRID